MKKLFLFPSIAIALIAGISACDDENAIGSSITTGEVSIMVDSTFTVTGRTVHAPEFDSRDGQLLIGRFTAEEYGKLQASFVGQLMPASSLPIPDSIPLSDVTGLSVRFTYNKKTLTGDTLSPQQLTIYPLTRQLPSQITNTFDPTGYYDSQNPLGSASYTASTMSHAASAKDTLGYVRVPMGVEFARNLVNEYRSNPSIFQWPETFVKFFPGIYVASTFGRGLLLNVCNTEFLTYYNRHLPVNKIIDGVTVTTDSLVCDSASLFTISPEVLSANILSLTPAPSITQAIADGRNIIQWPGGYNVEIDFPAQEILNRYLSDDFNMGVINSLSFTLPATPVINNYGINPPPTLLLIKSSKLKEFFADNKVPADDDTDAFWADYNSDAGQYTFGGMRPYIVDLMERGTPLTADDTTFTIIPVYIKKELAGSVYNPVRVITQCLPYVQAPTMCAVNITGSKVKFTYSRQSIR